jgi:hypothetical protein
MTFRDMLLWIRLPLITGLDESREIPITRDRCGVSDGAWNTQSACIGGMVISMQSWMRKRVGQRDHDERLNGRDGPFKRGISGGVMPPLFLLARGPREDGEG